jgi:putative transcriptional regulator
MSRHLHGRLDDFILGHMNHVEREEMEAHLAACEGCQLELAEAANLYADLGVALDPIAPSPGLRSRLLDAIPQAHGRFGSFALRIARLLDLTVEHVHQLLDSLEDPRTWEPGPYTNTELVHLVTGPAVAGAHAGFVRVIGGTRFPSHTHLGEERVFVLQGMCRDQDGTLCEPGQEIVKPVGSTHYFDVLDGPDFLYLVVLEGGVKFEVPPTTPVRGVPGA